ncbi:MAG: 2,3-bisphosphoglycerate-independent phosphoglycerate mutase [Deltaproteobacteria bacterium]|nr:2,3-bisphosphoglycerate-independent phosphoglycerate mutase [Deltaproteobacteria bacterium]
MIKHAQGHGPLVLIILDGWGMRAEKQHNGIALAHKPFFDALWRDYPHTLIDGSGPAVGLPKGVMGNSEVGHMNLGAGRIVYTGLSQIYTAIENGEFFKNEVLLGAVRQANNYQGRLHLMGLLSDGAVHSHLDHLYAMLEIAKQNNVRDVVIHCFMDGRDTPPKDGIKYITQLEDQIKSIGVGRIGSVSGRYYAMDRDQRWDRVETAFLAICGRADSKTSDYKAYMQSSYDRGEGDEFIKPVTVVGDDGQPLTVVDARDAMIFYNFRADRAREITRAFVDKNFEGFDRKGQQLPAVFVCASPYDKTIEAPIAFEPVYPKNIFPEILSNKGVRQLRIAETEKYAHVTFFFNGGRDVLFEGEERELIPSPKVATYDLMPEMSAFKVKDKLIEHLKSQKYGVVICNLANADMVGHTAVPKAIIKAVEVVDRCLSEIIPVVLSCGGKALVISDHGNAEEMVDKHGEPMTAHTTNLVPCILVSKEHAGVRLSDGGRLCDVAPTMLALMGLEVPKEMTGKNLVISPDP